MVLIALAPLAVALIFWPTTLTLVDLWSDMEGTYSYGLLLVPISAYLIGCRRAALSTVALRPSWTACGALAAAGLVWWLANLTDIRIVQQIAWLAMIVAVIGAVVGGRSLRVLAFPLGYLWLGIPIWSPLEQMLQGVTVAVVAAALPLVGVPLFVDGHFISIPSGQFDIEEACAGLRFVLTAVAISSLFAHLSNFPWRRALAFVLLAVGLAIVTNWARVSTVVWLGHVSEMQHPWVKDHLALGWWMFAVVLVPLFWIGRRLAPSPPADLPQPGRPRTARLSARQWGTAAAAALILLSAPVSAHWLKSRTQSAGAALELTAPPGWEPSAAASAWRPQFKGADAELSRIYERGGRAGAVYLAYYAVQGQGKELINELNAVYDRHGWRAAGERRFKLALSGRPDLSLREVVVSDPGAQRWLVWYWYHVADRSTASDRAAKLLQLWDLLGPRQGAAVVAVATPYESAGAASLQEARGLLRALVDGLAVDAARGPAQFVRLSER